MDKIIDMVGGENRGKEGKKAVGDAAIRLDWRPSKNVLHFSVVGLPSWACFLNIPPAREKARERESASEIEIGIEETEWERAREREMDKQAGT